MRRPQVNLTLVAPGVERKASPVAQEASAPVEEAASSPGEAQEEAALRPVVAVAGVTEEAVAAGVEAVKSPVPAGPEKVTAAGQKAPA